MQISDVKLSALASIFNVINPRVRATLGKAHNGRRGADLAFVTVEYGIEGVESRCFSITFIAKVTAKAGRWLDIVEHKGSDGEYHPNAGLCNELRALATAKVFAMVEINALAEYAEAMIADTLLKEQTAATPAPAPAPTQVVKNPFVAA